GTTLEIGNGLSLGSGTFYTNNGALEFLTAMEIPNNIVMLDNLTVLSGSTTSYYSTFTGNVELSPTVGGATRTITNSTSTTNNGSDISFTGVISNGPAGAAASNLIKAGTAPMALGGISTYTGTTSVTAGILVAGTNVVPNQPGAFGNSNTAIEVSGGGLAVAGADTIARDVSISGTAILGLNTVGHAYFTGNIVANNALTLASLVGAQVDFSGVISGAATTVSIGSATTNTNPLSINNTGLLQGAVRLDAISNGYGENTYAGGTTINDGRLILGGATNYTGSPYNPGSILSGPIGSGTLTFGGTTNAGLSTSPMTIEADPSNPSVVVNALAIGINNANQYIDFAGVQPITFTRTLNLMGANTNTNATRTFQVYTNPDTGSVTFSNTISDGGLNGFTGAIAKTGWGTLDLTGVNTFRGVGAAAVTINGGILMFNSDAALGDTSNETTTTETVVLTSGELQLAGATGPVITGRTITISASNSAIDVAPGNELILTAGIAGAFTFNSTDAGTLYLNPTSTNTITGTNIYGGGTVATNNTTNPFGATININSGTLLIQQGSFNTPAALANPTVPNANMVITPTTINFNSDSYIQLQGVTGFTTELNPTNLTRTLNGTLVIQSSTNTSLGGIETIIPGKINAVAPANTGAGILSANIVQQITIGSGTGAQFVSWNASNGIVPMTATPLTSFTGSGNTKIVSLSSTTAVNGGIVAFGVQTTGDITSGTGVPTLTISSTSSTNEGALLINGAANGQQNISVANLQFGTAAAGAGTAATLKEGLIYVAPGVTANLASSIGAGSLTVFGSGNLVFNSTIGGTNLLVPTATALGTMVLNGDTVSFASQASVPGFVLNNAGANPSGSSAAGSDVSATNQVTPGMINVAINGGGTLDLAGQNIQIAGLLTQTIPVTNGGLPTPAGGTVINSSSAAATLTVNSNNQTNIFAGTLDGNLALVKSGNGALILGGSATVNSGPNSYTGTTPVTSGSLTVNAGTVINAGQYYGSGLDAPIANFSNATTGIGYLQANDANALGESQDVVLNGGQLLMRADVVAGLENGNDIVNGFNEVLFGNFNTAGVWGSGGFGYNLTINPSVAGAPTNDPTSSTLTLGHSSIIDVGFLTAGAAAITINNLTMNDSTLTVNSNSTNATMLNVAGVTQLYPGANTLNVEAPSAGTGGLILGGEIESGTGGSSITKEGLGTLYLLAAPTPVGNSAITTLDNYSGLQIDAGTVQARAFDGAGDPLGTGPVTLLNGTLDLRFDGTGLGAAGVDYLFNNPLIAGWSGPSNATPANGYGFVIGGAPGAAGTLDTMYIRVGDINNANGLYGNMVFPSLTVGSALGGPALQLGEANSYSFEIAGTTTLNSSLLLYGNLTTFNGVVADNGNGYTIDKNSSGGSGMVFFNAANTFSGGFYNYSGTTMFGAWDGGQFTPSTTANLGTGKIEIAPNTAIRFNDIGNVSPGQTIRVDSNFTALGVVGIGDNSTPAQYDIHSSTLAIASGVLAINSTSYPNVLNESQLGNGTWYVGTTGNNYSITTNNGLQYGDITAGALLPGAGNTYRLGAGGAPNGTANLILTNSVLNDTAAGPASLIVGTPITNTALSYIGSGNGNLVLEAPSYYTGPTVVNRVVSTTSGVQLVLEASVATPTIDVFGQLYLSGAGGSLVNASDTGNTSNVILQPGSELVMDNYSYGALASTNVGGRLADNTPLVLNGAMIDMLGSISGDTNEQIGPLQLSGGTGITVQLEGRGVVTALTTTIPTRNPGDNWTLMLGGNTAANLGSDERVYSLTAPTVYGPGTAAPTSQYSYGPNALPMGMVAPYMVDGNISIMQFLSYSPTNGFIDAGYTHTMSST
ncbi:MAG TPA: autotransporter-associated beta strand repeat-containing protein, partial [Pirellulales bacterium]